MFVVDEDATDRSLVKFFRCTVCVGEHVSSEPVYDNNQPAIDFFGSTEGVSKPLQMI
jgi:hypothetical protein